MVCVKWAQSVVGGAAGVAAAERRSLDVPVSLRQMPRHISKKQQHIFNMDPKRTWLCVYMYTCTYRTKEVFSFFTATLVFPSFLPHARHQIAAKLDHLRHHRGFVVHHVRSSAGAVGGGSREPRTGGRKRVLPWLGWLFLSKSKVKKILLRKWLYSKIKDSQTLNNNQHKQHKQWHQSESQP